MLRISATSTATRRALLVGATLLALALACLLSWQWSPSRSSRAARPEECIWSMTQAAQEPNLEDYLDCFTGPLADRLRAQSRQKPQEFAARLHNGVAELTGLTVRELRYPAPDRAELLVERVFPRYYERQSVQLRRAGSEWKIERLGDIQRRVPEIPFGTPVSREAPPAGGDGKRPRDSPGPPPH